MIITNHAIKRYKQRFRCKSSSRSRVTKKIKQEIKTGTRWYNEKSRRLWIQTPKLTAVCFEGKIITILLPEEVYAQRGKKENERLSMY